MKVHITIGLPGSGKTELAYKLSESLGDTAGIITEELLYGKVEDEIRDEIVQNGEFIEDLIIDLLITNKGSLDYLKGLVEGVLSEHEITPEYILHFFNPTPLYSKVNDFVRDREKNANDTIDRMYGAWDFDLEDLEGEIILYPTYKPSLIEFVIWEKEISSRRVDKDSITSEVWSTDVWMQDSWGYSENPEDEEPISKYDFEALDLALEGLIGRRDDQLAKEIIDNLAETVHSYDTDDYYYGAAINYHTIDSNELVEYLRKKGLL